MIAQREELARDLVARLLIVVLLTMAASTAHAVDGVIEINQAKAKAGAVTAGDTPGFPVTISAPGSYRLTGDLDVRGEPNPENVTAIEITASDVTLDLNGFAILGPIVCTVTVLTVTSCASGTGRGITGLDAGAQSNVTVRNGTVRGMGSSGIHLFRGEARVEGVHVFSNGTRGIEIASGVVTLSEAYENGERGINTDDDVLINKSVARGNGEIGIRCSVRCTIADNVANLNGADGIHMGGAGLVSGNQVSLNKGDGIETLGGVSVLGNMVGGNTGFGLNLGTSAGTPSGYANNVISGNNGGDDAPMNPQVSGGVQFGTNMCGTDTMCP